MFFFFFNDTATTEIYTLSLHDALPISSHAASPRSGDGRDRPGHGCPRRRPAPRRGIRPRVARAPRRPRGARPPRRSEEHTSELQSRQYLVCRLLLEKKKKKDISKCKTL